MFNIKVCGSHQLFFCLILITVFGCTKSEPEIYLFSFFQNNGTDGLHLAYSEDGLIFTAINNNKSFLSPSVGKDKLMRDPCIIKGRDNKFHMVWTVSWNEKGIGYANSVDLIHWSEQKYIPVMHHEPNARNCWTPELFYDKETDRYLIYWATTIPGRFADTDTTGDNGYNHRMYFTTTNDFVSFSKTKILYDKGFNVIDATIHKIDEVYTMFLKNEIKSPKAEKNIRIATSTKLLEGYSQASEPITVDWVEGPTAVKTEKGWIVYFDMYTKPKMGAVISTDLKNWTDISDKIKFPDGTRHGTIFKAKQSVLNKILLLHSEK